MTTIRTRIARLAAASALALGLGVSAAGPALASYNSWAGSYTDSVTLSATDDGGATLDGINRGGGIKSVEDGAATDDLSTPERINSVDDGAGTAEQSPDGQIAAV